MNYYVKTSIGGRPENQDASVVFPFNNGKVFLICDGMGGVRIGKEAADFASQYVQLNLMDYFKRFNYNWKETINRLFFDINNYLCRKNPKMGTTISVVFIDHNKMAHIAHVGDSRVSIIRNKKIYFKTEDDSYVSDLINSGRITEAEAWGHQKSNVVTNILGVNLKLKVNHNSIQLLKGDKLLMSTDGMHDILRPEKVLKYFAIPVGNIIRTTFLMRAAHLSGRKINPTNYDNITFVLIDYPRISLAVKNVSLIASFIILLFIIFQIDLLPSYTKSGGKDQEYLMSDSLNLTYEDEIIFILQNSIHISDKNDRARAYKMLCEVLKGVKKCEQLVSMEINTSEMRDRQLLIGDSLFQIISKDSVDFQLDFQSMDSVTIKNILSLKSRLPK